MKLTNILLLIIFVSLLPFGGTSFSSETTVDGELQNGFRVLALTKTDQIQNFYVYRGDYIKFRLPDSLDATEVVFPTLKERKTLTKKLDTSSYIKMKKNGKFPFEINTIKGTITVIEYRQSSYKAVTAQEALDFIKQTKPFILDVRTPGEYKAGHLKNAVLIPVQILQSNLDQLDEYKNKPVLVYCATGNRSTVASKIMIDRGFKQIINLRRGIVDWHKKGFSVVR